MLFMTSRPAALVDITQDDHHHQRHHRRDNQTDNQTMLAQCKRFVVHPATMDAMALINDLRNDFNVVNAAPCKQKSKQTKSAKSEYSTPCMKMKRHGDEGESQQTHKQLTYIHLG